MKDLRLREISWVCLATCQSGQSWDDRKEDDRVVAWGLNERPMWCFFREFRFIGLSY